MQLGLSTRNMGRDWELPELFERCEAAGFAGVELCPGHAHGLAPSITATELAELRRDFERSPVKLVSVGLSGSWRDAAALAACVEEAREWARLAADLGCPTVTLKGDGLAAAGLGEAARSLGELAEYARRYGVALALAVGRNWEADVNLPRLLATAAPADLRVCWTCDVGAATGGAISAAFAAVAGRIALVRLGDLYLEEYPWAELFRLLRANEYDGYCLAEIAGTSDPHRVMRYYRALFIARLEAARSA